MTEPFDSGRTDTAARVCAVCDRTFGTDTEICPHDGTTLYDAEHDDELIGVVLDERYELRDLLGAGGVGVVYRAWQRRVGREVAVKVLRERLRDDPAARKRFLRELRVVSQLRHPNVIAVHDFGQSEDGLLYLVMEMVDGQSLRTIVDREGRLGTERALTLVRQAASGLAEAHAQGMVHRDIKPENLMVETGSGGVERVKILDFGLSLLRQTTQVGGPGGSTIIAGTPCYMSPESLQGERPTARSDVYALGVTLYELLAGVPPFTGDDLASIVTAHLHKEPVPLPVVCPVELPRGLAVLVDRMLDKDPAARPAHGVAVLEALEVIGADPPAAAPGTSSTWSAMTPAALRPVGALPTEVAATQEAAVEAEAIRARRSPWLWIVVAVLLIGLGGAVASWLAMPAKEVAPSRPPAPAPEPVVAAAPDVVAEPEVAAAPEVVVEAAPLDAGPPAPEVVAEPAPPQEPKRKPRTKRPDPPKTEPEPEPEPEPKVEPDDSDGLWKVE